MSAWMARTSWLYRYITVKKIIIYLKSWLLFTFFASDFYCLNDSHCNEKGSCNIDFGNCVCEESWNGFLDCTFCKSSLVPFQKVFFSASPSSGQLEPILSIFGTKIWQDITNYFCTNFKQEHFKFYGWPIMTFVEFAIEATLNQMEFVHLFEKKNPLQNCYQWQFPLGFKL